MPFLGVAPWRRQYFEGQPCPDDVPVPVDDPPTWDLYPDRRWLHNKLAICGTQGLPHGPHGTTPSQFPVFSKPIYNLRGMGAGGRVIASHEEYLSSLTPGHFWMPMLEGPHISTDLALADGAVAWCRHTTGVPAAAQGTFDFWIVHAQAMPELERYLDAWIAQNLQGFTGVINIETIGGRIIECHLRMADQWLDLNGSGWLAAVVELYASGAWRLREQRRTGYSVVLFGAHGLEPRVDRTAVAALVGQAGVSSIQITFDEGRPAPAHAMPPGGFRLAIINCWDLGVGQQVRSALAGLFSHAGAKRASPAESFD
ncbi:MAG TPA: hypothetical protein VLV76_23695 [Candidatus Acidoferrum sp.]|nr:hypothetical protein [Candidatus Acidoferrum sp.]